MANTNETGVIESVPPTADELGTTELDQESDEGQEVEVEVGDKKQKMLPMARFEKLNKDFALTKAELDAAKTKLGTFEAYQDFLDELKADGLNSAEDVRTYLAKQQMATASSTRDHAKQTAANIYHDNISNGYSNEDARALYDAAIERADVKYERATLEIEKAQMKRAGTGSVAKRISALLEKYPLADEETLRDLSAVPGKDLEAAAKRLHNREAERRVTYTKTKTEQRGQKGSDTAGGTTARAISSEPPPDPLKDPKGAAAWFEKTMKRLAKPPG